MSTDEDYLTDLSETKRKVYNWWKMHHRDSKSKKKKARRGKRRGRGKKKRSYSSSSSSSSSGSESGPKEREDEEALNITVDDEKRVDKWIDGKIYCGWCGKQGHGIARCWTKNGVPAHILASRAQRGTGNGLGCYVCGDKDHFARDCPKRAGGLKTEETDRDCANMSFTKL